MGCREDTRTIKGHDYYCRQWPPAKAIEMKLELMRVMGPAIAELASGMGDAKKDEDVDSKQSAALAHGISRLFEAASPKDVTALIIQIVSACTRDGERISNTSFDTMFIDDLLEPYLVCAFVIELNYKDFLGGRSLSNLAGLALKQAV